MARKREQEQPDAFVFHTDDGAVVAFCVECADNVGRADSSELLAFRTLQLHQWAAHSRRRVWIDFSDPRYRTMVNVALPIVLAHHTTRTA